MSVALALVTFAIFGQTATYQFVNYDDTYYVSNNPLVAQGLTWPGIVQAFAHGSLANWDPLTTLSHELDCQVFGLWPGGHHLTNILLHAASVVLLFLVLRAMTGTLWRSAFVAALFAVHPLRVESVAWIAERKDVLSGLFFMLTLGAYVRYVRQANAQTYTLVLVCYALGLMSKAMLVTMPFTLILLDYWPLRRFGESRLLPDWRLIREKIPLVVMAIASTMLGYLAQHASQAIQSSDRFPLGIRLENSVVSVAAYLWQMIFPTRLAVLYPFPVTGIPPWQIVVSLLVVLAITVAVIQWRRQRLYLLCGWLWYVGMLLPVIGLVQLGLQARADRYTYLPQIGVYLAIVWLVGSLSEVWKNREVVLGTAAGLIIAVLAIMTFFQVQCWQNSETLWTAALAHTTENSAAESYLGDALLKHDQLDEAIDHLQKAIAIEPRLYKARVNLGNALSSKGRTAEAIDQYRQSVQLNSSYPLAHYNLGMAMVDAGNPSQAVTELEECLRLDPTMTEAHNALGDLFARQGQVANAIGQFQTALTLEPKSAVAIANLERLAWILATCPDTKLRDGTKALQLMQQMSGLGSNPFRLCVLAAAQAETGQFDQAAASAETARTIATQQGDTALAGALQIHLNTYQAHEPFRDQGNPASRPSF